MEIEYNDRRLVRDAAGKTVAAVREEVAETLDLPRRAAAWLNDVPVRRGAEAFTIIADEDRLSFEAPSRIGRLWPVLLLAAVQLACLGWYAVTYTTSTATFNVTVPPGGGSFVDVSANNTYPLGWSAPGNTCGATGNGTLFDISTVSSQYTGDLVATLYCQNGAELASFYRYLNLNIVMYDSANNLMDINDDGTADISEDFVMLTLKNGFVEIPIIQADCDVYTIWVNCGCFLANAIAEGDGVAAPSLYCEVVNR